MHNCSSNLKTNLIGERVLNVALLGTVTISTTRSLCYRLPSLWNKMSFEYVKNIQQAAVFKGASTGASVYTAIVLLAQIAVLFSMLQRRKDHLGELLCRCMIIWLWCLSFCLVKSIQQAAVFKGASSGASANAAIVLLAQISVSFSMQQGRKYHLGKLLLRCMVIWLYCLSVCLGMTILEGNPAKFSCRVTNLETSLWRVQRPDGTLQALAQGDRVYSPQKEKFQLEIRNESSGSNTSYFQTLTLKDATVDDDGQYRCEEEGEIRNLTSLTVESTPALHLEVNNTVAQTNIDVVLSREVAVDCIAKGGKPPVTLSWWVNGEEVNGRFIDDPPTSHERVTSTIRYFPIMADKTLTCVASGQKVSQHTNVSVGLNVQYLPHCVMGIANGANAYVVTCSCIANPEVKNCEIYVNGLLFSNESKKTLPLENPATVFCIGTNDVGSFATKSQNLDPLHGNVSTQGPESWWIVLVIVLVAALA